MYVTILMNEKEVENKYEKDGRWISCIVHRSFSFIFIVQLHEKNNSQILLHLLCWWKNYMVNLVKSEYQTYGVKVKLQANLAQT